MLCIPAPTNPYTIANTRVPSSEVTAAQIDMRIPESATITISVLRGPRKWSAIQAGATRPGSPIALITRSRSRDDEGETWMLS